MKHHRGYKDLLLPLIAMTSLLAGCSGSSAEPEGISAAKATESVPETTSTKSPGESTTTVPMTDEEAIVDTYNNFLATWDRANNPPNPNDPGIARYAGGRALEVSVRVIQENLEKQIVYDVPENSVSGYTIEDLNIQGNSATMTVCLIDDGLQIHEPTGTILNDTVASSRIDLVFERREFGWVVTENNYQFTVAGADGCDV